MVVVVRFVILAVVGFLVLSHASVGSLATPPPSLVEPLGAFQQQHDLEISSGDGTALKEGGTLGEAEVIPPGVDKIGKKTHYTPLNTLVRISSRYLNRFFETRIFLTKNFLDHLII